MRQVGQVPYRGMPCRGMSRRAARAGARARVGGGGRGLAGSRRGGGGGVVGRGVGDRGVAVVGGIQLRARSGVLLA